MGTEEVEAAASVLQSGRIGGFGPLLREVERRIGALTGAICLGTTSATHALEAGLMGLGIGPGDEVIVPAYGFMSTATCVLRQRAQVVFADCKPDSPHLDPASVAARITPRTKAVIVIHYGGVVGDWDGLVAAVAGRPIALVEDAAHAFGATWKGRHLGTLGAFGCHSFHATKNITCGEGGAFLTRDPELARRVDLVRQIGTDRGSRIEGGASYTWRSEGSSFLPSEIQMAVLLAQLDRAAGITERRRAVFMAYRRELGPLAEAGLARIPAVPAGAEPNGHIFHLVFADAESAMRMRAHLHSEGIEAEPHYLSLDQTPFGRALEAPGGGACPNATSLAGRLLRLPIHARLSDEDVARVARTVLLGARTVAS